MLTSDLTFHPQCSPFPGTHCVCGITAYACLPLNWRGIFILALLTPQITIIPNNLSLPNPLEAYTPPKRAVQVIPLLIATGIMAGIGTRYWGHLLVCLYVPKSVNRV
jgi:hypothetical protein